MYLYLVRHGEALSKEEDPERGLSPEGIEQITRVAASAKDLGISVKQVLHSGKRRAMQTARILSEHIQSEAGLTGTDGLAPMDAPEIWLERISQMNEDVMLVGHLPHLAKLSSMALCGVEGNTLDFDAGSIVCLKRSDDNTWAVSWMIRPGMIL
jgi:phosphohistidine phosphatase